MKLKYNFFLAVLLISFSNYSFCKNPPPEKNTIKPLRVPTIPIKRAVPGTPFFRTIGNNGMAIQCKFPFNRTCLLFLKVDIDISDGNNCLNQFGTVIPSSGELIEPGTIHMGLYDEYGSLVYRDITNSGYQFNCDQGFFEIIFPNGY